MKEKERKPANDMAELVEYMQEFGKLDTDDALLLLAKNIIMYNLMCGDGSYCG